MKKLFAVICSVSLALPATAATVFTDKSAWETAMSGAALTEETFLNPSGFTTSLVTDTGIVSTAERVAGAALLHETGGGAFRSFIAQADPATPFGVIDVPQSIAWEFPTPISGFGFMIEDEPPEDMGIFLRVFLDTGAVRLGPSITGPTFYGFVSDSPFDRIVFEDGIGGSLFRITDLRYGLFPDETPPEVPLPAGLPLMLAGMAVLGFLKHGKAEG